MPSAEAIMPDNGRIIADGGFKLWHVPGELEIGGMWVKTSFDKHDPTVGCGVPAVQQRWGTCLND